MANNEPLPSSRDRRPLMFSLFSVIVSLCLIAFCSCIVAESKKAKDEQVRFNGWRCSVPRSEAFVYGILALICLSMIQTFGTISVCGLICYAGKMRRFTQTKKLPSSILLALMGTSWASFAAAVLLLGSASSMSRGQAYGKGWMDGDCYIVKDGIFVSAAVLVLVTSGCILITSSIVIREEILDAPSSVEKGQTPSQLPLPPHDK